MPLFEGAWSTNDITEAEAKIINMNYVDASFFLLFEMGFTVEMSADLIGLLAQKHPKSRLAAHNKMVSLT
jgi:hypothetical protein